MNRIYTLIGAFASVLFVNQTIAQTATTITSVALPQAGYTYNLISDTTAADLPTFTVTAGSGTAQTWNYSAAFANTYGESTAFVAPAGNPGASSFPNATIAADQGGGSWAYFIGNASGLYIDGAQATISGGTATIDFMPNEVLIPVPFTYSNTAVQNNYAATFTLTVSGQAATIKHRAKRTIKADAFGALTTPAGSYSNTLRLNTYETTSDSIFLFGGSFFLQAQYDTTTTYTWLQNTQASELMTISKDKTGAVTKAQYLQSVTTGINTFKHAEFASCLYPNPTNTVSYLNYENTNSSKVSASIYDLTGKEIVSILNNEQQAAGKHSLTIDVSNLQAGLYLVELTINGATKTIKLSVL